MKTFHHSHSSQNSLSRNIKFPQTYLNFDYLYSQSYCFFFRVRSTNFSFSKPLLPFHKHIFFLQLHTLLSTIPILTTNEMSIISRFRQFMVFLAVRVRSNVGCKRKLSWFFIKRLKEGANGIKIVKDGLKGSITFNDGLNHFSNLCATCQKCEFSKKNFEIIK